MKIKIKIKTISSLFLMSAFAVNIASAEDSLPVYGNINGDTSYYYKWETDKTSGGKILSEPVIVSNNDSVDPDLYDFVAKENSTVNVNLQVSSSTWIAGEGIENSFINLDSFDWSESGYYCGAICIGADSVIGSITGDFIGNYANAPEGNANLTAGGAINARPRVTISEITGNFIGNSATSILGSVYGGALYGKTVTITGTISGNFISNSAITEDGSAFGGAIYMGDTSSVSSITGNFTNNFVVSENSIASGGAIYLNFTTNLISGDFTNNFANSGTVGSAYGGAISNYLTQESITGDFIGNYAFAESITGSAYGGAIYNYIGAQINNISGSFIGNYTSSASDLSAGGAIYNLGTISINATTDNVLFEGNYNILSGDQKVSNAIFQTASSQINLNATSADIIINDGISANLYQGELSAIIDINTGLSNKVEFNNSVENHLINVSAGTLTLGYYAGNNDLFEDGTNVVVDSSKASLDNSLITVYAGATLNIATDVLLSNNSTIKMNDNAILIIDENSSLVIDLGDLELDATFSYTFMEFEDVDDMTLVLTSLLESDNFAVSVNGSTSSTTWEISESTSTENGNWLVVSGTVIPEPSTYALIFGILSLGFVYYRKRK